MASIFDPQSIDIPCPNCRAKHPKTIAWIKANDKIACRCGATINLDKRKFVSEIAKTEKMLDAFQKKLTIRL